MSSRVCLLIIILHYKKFHCRNKCNPIQDNPNGLKILICDRENDENNLKSNIVFNLFFKFTKLNSTILLQFIITLF